jgi:STE24 endopeptidase
MKFKTILIALTIMAASILNVAPRAAIAASAPNTISSPAPSDKTVTEYSLPPDLSKKATELGAFHFRFEIFGIFFQVFALWLLLHFKVASRFRDWAEKLSPRRWVQALIFTPPLLLSLGALGLPLDIYAHSVSREYGLSIQGWGSWLGDWLKGQAIEVIIGIILVSILFWVIRRNPKRWWFYFWLASLPILLSMVFIQPLVIDPLFHKFEPLQSKDPALTARLQQLVSKVGQDIPPERMFWMGAGEKTTTLNAYVTGLGSSKRIVVWDTTIAKMTTDQIVFVTGHEMGHYVLGHIWKSLIFSAFFFLLLFYLGSRFIGGLLQRYGNRWGIRSIEDWAALPALILLISFLSLWATPVMSALSRHIEHQADQYGLEATHGLLPKSGQDPGQKAAQAFQVLGEVGLSEVHPNPVNVFLFYSHPTITDRILFALSYDPWSKGESPAFVH